MGSKFNAPARIRFPSTALKAKTTGYLENESHDQVPVVYSQLKIRLSNYTLSMIVV